MENIDYLGKEKISKLLLKYSLPCVLSLVIAALYNIVDQFFIANSYLGSFGNAANTICYPLTVIALALAVMIGDGCCSFISIKLGEKKNNEASHAFIISLISISIISIIITLIYLFLNMHFFDPTKRSYILELFGLRDISSTTYDYASTYFFYITLGIPFYIVGQCLNPIIRSDSSPRFAMITGLVGAIINIILDPIFIYLFKWGMMGAALATILGQIVTFSLSILYFRKTKVLKITKEGFKFSFRTLGRVCMLGLCSLLSQISLVFAMSTINNMISKYAASANFVGDLASIPMAVVGIVMKFFQIIISIAVGMAAGSIPIIGYNIGSKNYERVKKIIKELLLSLFILGIISFFIIMVFPKGIIKIFGGNNTNTSAEFNEQYISFGVKCFRIYLSMVILAVINKGTFIMLQAMGKAITSTVLSMIREILFGVGFAYILPLIFGFDGILYSMPVSDILTFIISLIVLIITFKSLNKYITLKNN